MDHEPVPLLIESKPTEHVAVKNAHVTLPNKEVTSATVPTTAKSPVADRRLWIDFAVIFVLGLVLVQLFA